MIRSVFIFAELLSTDQVRGHGARWEVDFLPQAFDESKVLLMMFRFLHVLYWASIPPSTTREVPVVNFASSEQR
jgi:hypothetical protein